MATQKAGSLEPIDAGKGKWHHNIDAAGIGQLSALATDINKAVDQTVKQVARGKIRVGKLLREARDMFVDDGDFGKWRKENTLVQSKQHAHYLMQVADRFGDAPKLIEGANYSVMQELVLADQPTIEWVESKIDEGEPPTVQEVRAKVKESRPPLKGTSKKGTSPGVGTMQTPNANINIYVSMGLTRRIQAVVEYGIKGIEGDLIILGLDPDPQIPCHIDCLNAVRDWWGETTDNPDELRAIRDSYDRVYDEFKNWTSR